MIEKLSEYKITSRDGAFINVDCNAKIINTLVRKINEIVDIVNKLTMAKSASVVENDETPAEKEQDKFAEQRKWVGKLCMFWDKEIGEKVWGILGGIDYSENEKYPYLCDQLQEQYQCCEPVKPDDDIIYKGGDNE